ncbi:hypothetical protein [Candidatus Aquiluna sp. UB-MaderosW2red]|uniref:hypothetical protein n=1 Tax=Candidatus Aquiluna sp. UB-MaderosW2red TaxID=1855377 RepID=UPI000875C8AC|nr:hypothetical protein [Candidatus Aquiluna sp. UB-MaderosW2red]SCX08421.1 hypothetical protein SAMN05216534_0776 [Candidatus Aquiluna sp. UB-MaderosW2red]
MKTRPIISVITMLLGLGYAILVTTSTGSAFGDAAAEGDAEAIGAGLGVALLLPHILLTWLAVVFNILGYFTRVPGFTLTAAIIYTVAAFLGFFNIIFLIPIVILAFISWVQEKKRKTS